MKQAHAAPARIRGFSLVELMVSLTIGLILMVAVVSAYLGSAGAGRMAEAQGRMNEDAQAALGILTQQIRMSGNNPKRANRTSFDSRNSVYVPTTTTTFATTYFSARGCDGTFSNVTSAATLDALTCVAGTTTLPDSIAVNYEADRYNTVPTSAGVPTDCLGQSLTGYDTTVVVSAGAGTGTGTATYYVADNRFYITSTAALTPSLYCKGNGGAAQPLVENIEDLQFSYGTSPASTSTATVAGSSATVAGYLDAYGVETNAVNDTGGANLAGLVAGGGFTASAKRWTRVMTVRICVLARSEGPVAPDAASARYTRCDGTVETNPPDLRLRRAYSTTVVLRNRMY